jgi:ribonucleoside-triphosphate reductase
MYVIKRNGTIVPFEKEKIITAINKAFLEVDGQLYETDTANDIADEIEQMNRHLTVEDIQNLVEDFLMQSERRDVARAYIRFRYKREVAREQKETFYEAIAEKLEARNVKNQNANVDEHSFGGRMGEANDVVTKQYALDHCVSKMARDNHVNNRIYIHDLSHYAVGDHNCLSVPFDHLLANGFNTRQTDVRPAGSLSTAFQLVAVIFQLQSLQQFGGVSATHLDWTMVPYVRKSFMKHYIISYIKTLDDFTDLDLFDMSNDELDEWVDNNKQKYLTELNLKEDDFYFDNKTKLNESLYQSALFDTKREAYQAAEGLYHNLNTLQSRSGNQLPFTSINYGTCTLPEGRMIIKALLETSIAGLGKNKKTSIFPCGIFQVMSGVNKEPGTPNHDMFELALKSTAQRLYPNYANVDWSGNAGYDRNDPTTYFSTMGK